MVKRCSKGLDHHTYNTNYWKGVGHRIDVKRPPLEICIMSPALLAERGPKAGVGSAGESLFRRRSQVLDVLSALHKLQSMA